MPKKYLTLEEQIEARVDRSSGPDSCWPWTGRHTPRGYGKLYHQGASWQSHRVAWELANGRAIPTGMCVCHTCDNPPCCNPTHLWVGTHADNMRDCVNKRRNGKSAIFHGEENRNAKLTEQQVLEIRASYVPRKVTLRCLAARYGITHRTVRDIVVRETWRHI